MPGNLSCGAAIAGLLEAYGVDTVFGIPGVHTLELYKGLAGSSMRHVLVRHEQGAGFMADGYARSSGHPGVCFVITGPGVTNVATAIGQAASDSVPMLVISSVNARDDLGKGRGRLHEISDQRAVTEPLTAASHVAMEPEDVVAFFRQAFSSFASARPRPVHLSVPLDVLDKPAGADWRAGAMAPRPTPDDAAVNAARELLARAHWPVLLLGGGAVDIPQADIVRLAETAGAAVVSTTAGKGIFPESHPLSLGATLSRPPAQAFLAGADLVMVIGSELSETDSWTDEPLQLGGAVVRVDIAEAQLAVNAEPALAIRSDAAAFVNALGDPESTLPKDRQMDRVAAVRQEISAGRGALARKHIRVLDTIRAVLPADGFVATDMTQIAYTGNTAFPVDLPRCWFHPVGFGTLGYALPAAIGAKLADPQRPGVALAGDYGFQFTLPELGTATELALTLPVILWNNDGLGQIRDGMVAAGIPEIGVVAQNPDFQALAKAYGCSAVRPQSLDALGRDLQDALAAPGPTLIEIRQDMPDLA
jgi:5-guanidino-2-oxopentanoate decarboxylase